MEDKDLLIDDVTLDTPILAQPGQTRFFVERVMLDWTARRVEITLRAWNGTVKHSQSVQVVYDVEADAEAGRPDRATPFLRALMSGDFSTTSLHANVLQRLQAEGALGPGKIEGGRV